MGIIKSNHKVASVVHHSHLLLPVLNRFGIRLGVKEKTIEQVCEENHLNVHFVLAILNAYHNKDYFPEDELRAFSAQTIVNYLRKTHEYYINYVLIRMDDLLYKLIASGGEFNSNLLIIKTFYNTYKKELLNHIDEEESVVFPYIIQLQSLLENNEPRKNHALEHFSIIQYQKEHSNVDDKLNDLKNIIIKFLDPVYDDNTCNAFLASIYQLEQDLADHSRIEDLILVPKVIEMEKLWKHDR